MYQHKQMGNGFEYIEVQNSVASAKIALQGAHIFEYTNTQRSPLWVSKTAFFEYGKAIRGGIPLCWPRFGNRDTSMPQHGFARTQMFELEYVEEKSKSHTELCFVLQDNEQTRKIWNYGFALRVVFHIGDTLRMELQTTNSDTKDFMITQALHSYFQVSDIKDVMIYGLENKRYWDALEDKEYVQEGAVTFEKETDRVYMDVDDEIVFRDQEKKSILRTKNAATAIVWNPWRDKAATMVDMEDDAYREFVCIESANAFDDYKIIKPQTKYSLYLEVIQM